MTEHEKLQPETPQPLPPAQRRGGTVTALILLVAVLAIIGAAYFGYNRVFGPRPDPETIATASIEALREQNRLNVFAARYVAVVTSSESRLGLSAKKTLIMPGDVRYEIDLGALDDDDVEWDGATNTLSIALPEIEIAGPEIDINAMREYGEGGILLNLTDAEDRIDKANRRAGRRELLRQARQETTLKLARDSARRAVERNFSVPLRAAGIDAEVIATFPGEEPRARDRDRVDASRRPEDVLREKAERR